MFTSKNLIKLAVHHILIAFGVVFIAIAMIWFLSGQINKTADNIIKNRQLTNNFDKQTELLFKLRQDAVLIGGNDVLIENALLSSDNILEFINALDGIAAKNKAIQTFVFNSPISNSESTPIPLSSINYVTNISTNISALKNYLVGFEGLPYFSKINSIIISSQDKDGWRNNASVSFSATLFTKVVE